jgi:lipopolysaccharide export LptBFGC system permease protein LptF
MLDLRLAVLITLLSIVINAWGQEQTQQLVDEGQARLKQNQESQQAIDNTFEKIQGMEKEFQNELQMLDSLNMYNAMLQRQLEDQQTQIGKINTSINNVTLIERQIMPLLVRMVEALDSFVSVDLPFLQSERSTRVNELKDLLNKAE